ncbi:hypothetical protein G7Y89_g2350 [Cudoniella acicularis]|uniref:Uncharacterized protein n=1 Tax=Cudoniella acicularis TaxID=354080 RepID=A0A8H4W667_9HELO|nr:hypothetical protein G7Y89_g2350 [Cudoniella acicularis]
MPSSPRETFLTLPAELRLQIYALVFHQIYPYNLSTIRSISSSEKPYNPVLSLTLVSRQIRNEVLALTLAKSRYFSSLTAFCSWVSRAPDQTALDNVRDVSISIIEGKLEGIFRRHVEVEGFGSESYRVKMYQAAKDNSAKEEEVKVEVSDEEKNTANYWLQRYISQFGNQAPLPSPKISTWSKLLSSILTITLPHATPTHPIVTTFNSFTAIRNVRRLWLHLGAFFNSMDGFSKQVADEQELILEMLSTTCPNITDFTIMSRRVRLSYLLGFPHLRSLQFDGFSKTPPEVTIKILNQLPKLEELVLYRYPHNYARELPDDEYVSITPEVLSSLQNPLKSLRIWHLASDFPAPFLTVPFIRALSTHRSTLRRLQVVSEHPLEPAVVEALLDFIVGSKVTTLEVKVKVPLLMGPMGFMGEADLKAYLPSTAAGGKTRVSCEVSAKDRRLRELVMVMECGGASLSRVSRSQELADHDLQIDWDR